MGERGKMYVRNNKISFFFPSLFFSESGTCVSTPNRVSHSTEMRAFVQCVQKVAARLQKLLEVMSTSVYTDLNPFNFIRKHFLQICL